MRAIPLLPLLLGGWLALPVQADDAQDAISRLAKADQQQSYQGTFVYERNGSFSTHRIWHRIAEGKVQERLLQLDGSAQEVLRVDGLTQCVSGTLEAGVANPADSTSRAFDVKKLSAWYDIKIVGKSRVAGRQATIVALSPKDQHRYGLELHLDNETGLVLKSLLLSEKGQLLERFQFTDLDTAGNLSDQMLKVSADCKPVSAVKVRPESSIGPVAWHSDWLPPGFEISSSGVRKNASAQSSVTRLMYGDGLARFSVFIEAVKGGPSTDIRTQLGPTVAVSRRLATPQGDMMVTVVGEIPMGTAERIALSMRYDESPAKK
ncbi:MucB/RseB C-terminal domain-containing protein [Pseudomonas syringae pv. tagetis]|uniref:MucB/RseB C-terminal domain-containing protein n=2 Tax=Pseudomonas syringae group genomosp. 7 TaxID=251699 RepID=A0A0Q0C999_9PSED|nr:MucB/RseB C-terminal domain-containing protein [Pseudomonas syringae group genomosp. 7]KPX49879.1 Sigma E regulatory protein, MucB/RseB [Pseudomonas syringae pv. helianthi]KPY84355.1 Sigma E regulatory protein, MucB/RseB [Pseudomonas syringae pv. tagetis]RMW11492.1 Sigma E regulatory protein, MucB/RseB [Pseudomonas syringae pv. tagetis]RMW20273.1 Sigma E regulatory protein, MucB/RseB [Pseudomonas syringae pv. tagetis]UNB64452.1 MucB/RseB C-terminal domain-containing protein [Pseudomonas syr